MVVVDGNLWIVDFGGGVTEGWVDVDKADSRERDLQALSRITEILDPTGLAMLRVDFNLSIWFIIKSHMIDVVNKYQ